MRRSTFLRVDTNACSCTGRTERRLRSYTRRAGPGRPAALRDGVTAAQRSLEPLVQVRILVPQLPRATGLLRYSRHGTPPLDEVRRRLRVVGQVDGGLQEIPVDRIVGSVDGSGDFGRDFAGRRSFSRGRLAGLRAAFPDGDLPPIDVYEVGGLFFVSDGDHRVAFARERGAHFLDAYVTRLQTNHDLPPYVRRRSACPHRAAAPVARGERPRRQPPPRGDRVPAPARLSRAARDDQGPRLRPASPARCRPGSGGPRRRPVRPRLRVRGGRRP